MSLQYCVQPSPDGLAQAFILGRDFVDGTHFLYKTTDVYARDCERAIRWDDPALAIAWPLAHGQVPRVAPKDAAAPTLDQAELPVFGG